MSHRKLQSFLIVLVFMLFTRVAVSAQLGGLVKHKEKEVKPVSITSDQAPDLSDSDKKKLAEIEQRPEVKDLIDVAWENQRIQDLEYAYRINTSLRRSLTFDPSDTQLYDNPILQRYLNNIGQRLVPKDSPNVYSFKLLLDPVPRAEALSTGTVYVSTGLVALLDNEAQLSYVLAHEIAHVEKNHAYAIVKNRILEDELNREREADAAKKRAIFSAVATGIGAGIGAATGGGRGAFAGAGIGLLGGVVSSALIFRAKTTATEWPAIYENEADESGFRYMLDQNYDAREIPKLYARLDGMTTKDARVGLGFIGKPVRVKARRAHIQSLLSGSYKAELDSKLKAKGLTGSSAEFPLLMSALKRDNGIIALDYDLFAMSRDNLEEAVNLRSNDASAQFYLGRVISITSRTPADRQEAETHFEKAIAYDEGRGAYPDPHLERAIHLIADNNPSNQDDIRKELQSYVALYQREHAGALPRNMTILYDYFTLAGDTTWYVPPASVVSTKNVESLSVSNGGGSVLSAKDVVQNAISPAPEVQPAVLNKSSHPKVKPTSK